MNTHSDTQLGCEAELIVISAGAAARRDALRERSLELARAVDWQRLTELLRAQRLLATLGPHVMELAGECATESFASSIEQELAMACRQGALLQLVSERLTTALCDAGIRSTVMKGPLLSEAAYGEPGRRQSSDIDLLVATDQLHRAVAVVEGLGYEAPGDHVGAGGLPLLHFALAHVKPPVTHEDELVEQPPALMAYTRLLANFSRGPSTPSEADVVFEELIGPSFPLLARYSSFVPTMMLGGFAGPSR